MVLHFSHEKQNAKVLIENFLEHHANIQSLEYDTAYRMKSYFNDDTLLISTHVSLIKDSLDTIYGGAIWIEQKNYIRYYDFENIYFIKKEQEKIVKYDECDFSNIKTNCVTTSELKKKFEYYKNRYTLSDYERPTLDSYKLLDKGEKAPELVGTFFHNNSTLKLSDYKGRVVLLDFWYRKCIPCLTAIPSFSKINSLYEKKAW